MRRNDLGQHLYAAVRMSRISQLKLQDNEYEKHIRVDALGDWECRQELELMVHQEHQAWVKRSAILLYKDAREIAALPLQDRFRRYFRGTLQRLGLQLGQ